MKQEVWTCWQKVWACNPLLVYHLCCKLRGLACRQAVNSGGGRRQFWIPGGPLARISFSLLLSITEMPRSAWKGPFFVTFPGLRQAIQNGTPIATQGNTQLVSLFHSTCSCLCLCLFIEHPARSCTILPSFVGLKFLVHNGKDYMPVMITEEMIGHKLGEFSFTRKRFNYRFTKAK